MSQILLDKSQSSHLKSVKYYHNLADLYIRSKNYEEALRILEKSLTLSPNEE